jgi:hypothetical protein
MRPTVTGSQPPTLAAAKKKCPPEAHLAFSEAIVSPPAAPHPSLVNDKGAKRSAGQGLPSRVLGRIGIGSSSPPVQPRRSKHTNPSPAPGLDCVCNQVWEPQTGLGPETVRIESCCVLLFNCRQLDAGGASLTAAHFETERSSWSARPRPHCTMT